MARPRSQLVSLDATPYYHCIARCVRRAFLCGDDAYSGQNFDHRKPWLIERLALLAECFAIDIAAYAVMSNHYHLVLHIDAHRAASWSDEEVVRRWTRLYKGPLLIQDYLAGNPVPESHQDMLKTEIKHIRSKLCNISRFMACLNEYIARKANAEDKCTGRFWEGRFKSQALLDEAALVSCMAYVDLNPVRAGIANSLESSDYTSVQNRVWQVSSSKRKPPRPKLKKRALRLMPFAEGVRESDTFSSIPFNLKDYIELVERTGRCARPDKKGQSSNTAPRVLQELGLSENQWRILSLEIQKESISMLDGLMLVEKMERKAAKTLAA